MPLPFKLIVQNTASLRDIPVQRCLSIGTLARRFCSANPSEKVYDEPDEFRVLDLKKTSVASGGDRRRRATYRDKPKAGPPRSEGMRVDQDWVSVWPGPRTFHPSVVPLPLRQGVNNLGAPPNKYANAELMKIPNFLHLTPPAVARQCKALKRFCTEWPRGLETDEDCKRHFPVEVTTSDYCHSSPTIRDPLARIVTLQLPLGRLELDNHSRDKLIRLVGDRYDPDTDLLTIVTDKCPLKSQNLEYALYLLTAVYHESWKVEPWEVEKSEADLEYFDWEASQSKRNAQTVAEASSSPSSSDDSYTGRKVDDYGQAVINLFDNGENEESLKQYKEAALALLFPAAADAPSLT